MLFKLSAVFSMQQGACFLRNHLLASTGITCLFQRNLQYVHPDLEVEFLTPERGRGRSKPYAIDKLHINAQGLRYLDLIQRHTLKTSYKGVSINVPEPTAYVLHKFIVSNRRTKPFKREKDIETARQFGEYLLEQKNQKKKMREIYSSMPEKWKKDLIKIVKGASEKIYTFLNSIED